MSRFLAIAIALLVTGLGLRAEYALPSDRVVDWITYAGHINSIGNIATNKTIYTNLPGGVSAATINSAIDNCPSNQVVALPADTTLTITGTILVDKSGVTLRGYNTTIAGNITTIGGALVRLGNPSFSYDYTLATSYNMSSGYTRGSSNIVFASAPDWIVGDIVLLDEIADGTIIQAAGEEGNCSFCGRTATRNHGQHVRVTAIVGTSVTFEPPLAFAFSGSATPQGQKMVNRIDLSGIEGITFTNTSATLDSGNIGLVVGTFKSWVMNCVFLSTARRSIWAYENLHLEIRDSSSHGIVGQALLPTNDRGYGFFLDKTSFSRVENNVFTYLAFPTVMEGWNTGNATVANFMTNVVKSPAYSSATGIGMHAGHVTHCLWEQNYVIGSHRHDRAFASGSDGTLFRERAQVADPNPGQADAVDQYNKLIYVATNHPRYSIVGCVLGNSTATAFEYGDGADVFQGSGNKVIRHIGARTDSDTTIAARDTNVTVSLIWHVTQDTETATNGGVRWQYSDTALPVSLAYAAKPAWWGDRPWPWVEPASPATAVSTNFPAGYRAHFGTNPPAAPAGPSDAIAARQGTGKASGARARGAGLARGF